MGVGVDSLVYTQTGYGICQSRQKFSQKIQNLTRVNVFAYHNFYDILTLTILGNDEKKISADSYICHFFFSIFSSPEQKAHMSTLGVRRLSSAINLSQFLPPFLENH